MRADKIREKVAGLRRQMQYLKDMAARVEAAPDNQISLTDPDARSMARPAVARVLSATLYGRR